MILSDFLKALGQFGDARFRRVMALGIGLTLALFVALGVIVFWLVGWLAPDTMTLPWVGEVAWLDTVLSWAGVLILLALSVFLMVPVASAFTGIFLDDVAQAVEDRHFPALPPARPVPLAEMLRDTLGLFALIIVLNLGLLVVYVFSGPLVPLLFWAVNGFLLGREYFQTVAIRRMTRPEARALRSRHWAQIWLAGILMAAPLTVPIVNLFVPVLGAATFTHLFHRLAGTRTEAAPRSPRG